MTSHPTATPPTLKRVSTTWLIGIYAILPICLVFQLIDTWLLDRTLWHAFPKRPEGFALFTIFFGTPHIIASCIIFFANPDYRAKYRRPVLQFSIVLGLVAALLFAFTNRTFIFIVIACWTVLHVVKQQLSIGNSCYRLSGGLFQAWNACILGASMLIFNMLYLKRQIPDALDIYLETGLGTLAAGAVYLSFVLHTRIETTRGKVFFWSNTCMMLLCGYLLHVRYHLLVILAPRIIHDITAFTFYMVHDHNKHGASPGANLYRWTQRIGVHVFWVSPLLAIGITALLNLVLSPAIDHLTTAAFGITLPLVAGIVGYLSMLHYFTEAFTWRRESPYRKYVPLKF